MPAQFIITWHLKVASSRGVTTRNNTIWLSLADLLAPSDGKTPTISTLKLCSEKYFGLSPVCRRYIVNERSLVKYSSSTVEVADRHGHGRGSDGRKIPSPNSYLLLPLPPSHPSALSHGVSLETCEGWVKQRNFVKGKNQEIPGAAYFSLRVAEREQSPQPLPLNTALLGNVSKSGLLLGSKEKNNRGRVWRTRNHKIFLGWKSSLDSSCWLPKWQSWQFRLSQVEQGWQVILFKKKNKPRQTKQPKKINKKNQSPNLQLYLTVPEFLLLHL